MKLAVVIPCFKVREQILGVIETIGPEAAAIYVVDDCCPAGSGRLVGQACPDPRVKVLFNEQNQGVGGAVMRGYQAAVADGMEVVVKLDGDGQMPAELIPLLVAPIGRGEADYVKGNRFFTVESVKEMPLLRLLGNAALSFATKLSTGYWSLFDPTNGFTAIHVSVLAQLPMDKIARRYFFETDMLFRLNVARAVVAEMPMTARYRDEKSNLRISRILLPFALGHLRNFTKRIFYNYFLRGFQLASVELVIGLACILFGVSFGVWIWSRNEGLGVNTPPGPVMLAALPIMTGVQLLLAFLNFDVKAEPSVPLHPRLPKRAGKPR
ncbi:MAG TPA: glycosyltransferase family 2 protein [Magnetospirillaceae bacterium]|nr:glycosyltransferase family 2 protein [Magnetospirillaceae bacterium]